MIAIRELKGRSADTINLVAIGRQYYSSRLDSSPANNAQAVYVFELFDRWSRKHLGRHAVVSDLSEETIMGFLTWYRDEKKAAPATIKGKRGYLLTLWRMLADDDLLDRYPKSRKIRLPRAPLKMPVSWTVEEVRAIYDAAGLVPGSICGIPAGIWWRCLLSVLYETGARIKAVMSTNICDVDLDSKVILFTADHDKTHRDIIHHLSDETVSLIRETRPDDRAFFWAQRNRKVNGCTCSEAETLLFPWPYSWRELNSTMKRRILNPAGVTYGREHGGVFHKMRRTAGTLCERHGGDGAKLLGNGREVFNRHYLDRRQITDTQSQHLPSIHRTDAPREIRLLPAPYGRLQPTGSPRHTMRAKDRLTEQERSSLVRVYLALHRGEWSHVRAEEIAEALGSSVDSIRRSGAWKQTFNNGRRKRRRPFIRRQDAETLLRLFSKFGYAHE